jgi:glutathione S-transferase
VSEPRVTLYGRDGCHLCDEARTALLELRERGARFELREVDVESDEELHRSMLELIPVVEVDGERVSELIFDADAFLARLDTLSP